MSGRGLQQLRPGGELDDDRLQQYGACLRAPTTAIRCGRSTRPATRARSRRPRPRARLRSRIRSRRRCRVGCRRRRRARARLISAGVLRVTTSRSRGIRCSVVRARAAATSSQVGERRRTTGSQQYGACLRARVTAIRCGRSTRPATRARSRRPRPRARLRSRIRSRRRCRVGCRRRRRARREFDLSWGAASDNVAVTGYQVFRCQGAGCSNFVQVGELDDDRLQQYGVVCEHELQLSGAGGRRGRQPGPVLGDRDRERRLRSRIRSRRRCRVGCRRRRRARARSISAGVLRRDNVAVTGYQVFRCQGAGCSNFVAGGELDDDRLQQYGVVCEHELQLSGAGGRRGRQPGRRSRRPRPRRRRRSRIRSRRRRRVGCRRRRRARAES